MGVHTARLHGTCFYYTACWMELQGKDGRIGRIGQPFPKAPFVRRLLRSAGSEQRRAVSVPFRFRSAQLGVDGTDFFEHSGGKGGLCDLRLVYHKDLQAGVEAGQAQRPDQSAFGVQIIEKWGVMPTQLLAATACFTDSRSPSTDCC